MMRFLIVAIVSVMSLSAHSASAANGGFGLLQVADAQTDAPAAAAPANKQLDDAAKVMQAYMTQVSTLGMDGTSVYDISVLPDSKANIQAALVVLLGVAEDEKTKSDFQTGVMLLAFFQPGVGETPISLEEMGPNEQTWRQVVETEIQSSQ